MPKSLAIMHILLLAALVGIVAYDVFKPAKQPPRTLLEYDVVTIPDNEWKTQGNDLGAAGWEIVTCRRASDAERTFAYECIMKRPRFIPQ